MRRSVRLHDVSRSVTLTWADAGSFSLRPSEISDVLARLLPFLRDENLALVRGFVADDITVGPIHHATDNDVVDLVVRLVVRGQVEVAFLAAPILPVRDGDDEEDGEKEREPEQPRTRVEPRTWIEIDMVDMAGQPLPNIRYVIELPDGSERTGMLDQRGRARVDGIDPGQCNVRFPDFDQDAWERI